MSDFYKIYYEARRVCLKMLGDRNYNLPPNVLLPITDQEFEIMYEKKQIDIGDITDNEGLPTYIKFIKDSTQFNKTAERAQIFSEIAKYFSAINPKIIDDKTLIDALNNGLIRVIIIFNAIQSGQVQNKYEEEYMSHPFLEIHQVHNMAIDPTHHKYQPKFTLITNQEDLAKILRRYDAKPLMFGSISIDDPINRYYRGRPSENGHLPQMYTIVRGGLNIFYRKVISKRMNLK